MIIRKTIRAGVVSQFRRPTGIWGALAGFVMSHRPSNRRRTDWTLELLDIRPTDRVLEIGLGPGLGIRGAAERAHRGEVYGIDHSAVMLRQASKRNAAAIAAGRVKLRLASVDALPDFSRRFDKVFGVNVHLFWNDAAAVIAALFERLQPGGTLALTFQPRKAGATDADTARAGETLTALLEQGGFQRVRAEILDITPSAVCVLGVAQGADGLPAEVGSKTMPSFRRRSSSSEPSSSTRGSTGTNPFDRRT